MSAPRLLRLLARLLLPRRDREIVLGDLEELHALRAERHGRGRAGLRYVRDLLGSAVLGRMGRRRAFGGAWRLRPQRAPVSDALARDLRAAARSLVREKGFSAVAILTLALGIGPAAAVFGMVNQLVLRPLPGVADPDGAAYLRFRSADGTGDGLTAGEVDALRRALTSVDGLASYGNGSFQVSAEGSRPVSVRARAVYGDFFEVLGVRPAEGRLLRAPDTDFGAERSVAVVSQALRTRLFGPGVRATGRTVLVSGRPVRILGVTGGGFQGVERGRSTGMWIPFPALNPLVAGFTDEILRTSSMHNSLVVRLPAGASAGAVEARIDGALSGIGEGGSQRGEGAPGLRATLLPGLGTPPEARPTTRRTLTILAGIVGLVLVLACANVANLLLFRNVARRADVAVRRALGASSGQIARTHLVLGLVLAGLGTLAGLVVGWAVTLPLRGESLLGAPALEGFVVDRRILLFAAIATVSTTVLFGTLPAALAGRFDPGGALREAGRGGTGRGAGLRHALASGQVALSLALLIGGILLVRTMRNLYAADTGMSIEGVAVLPLELPGDLGPGAREAEVESVVTALQALPRVEDVALGHSSPLEMSMGGRVGRTGGATGGDFRVEMIPASASWFGVLGIRGVDGAPLRIPEDEWGAGDVVVTASLARRLFGGVEGVVGRTVRAGFGDLEEARIVAVSGDLRAAHAPDAPRDAFVVPFDPSWLPTMAVLVRASRLDAAVLEDIRVAAEASLPDQAVPDPIPLRDRLDRIHSERRVLSRLLGLLSVFAVILVGVGLYGVVAFAVAGRRREFGVRTAMGAKPSRIAGLLLRYAGSMVLVGTVLGLGGGYALSRVLRSRLFGVEPVDVLSYGSAVILLAGIVAVACWVPVRRAMGVDPVTVLNAE